MGEVAGGVDSVLEMVSPDAGRCIWPEYFARSESRLRLVPPDMLAGLGLFAVFLAGAAVELPVFCGVCALPAGTGGRFSSEGGTGAVVVVGTGYAGAGTG